MKKNGCRWVRAAAPVASHRLCLRRNLSTVVSPSSVGLGGDAFGASSVIITSTHAASPSNASAAVVLVIGSVSVERAFLSPALALQTLVLVLWTIVLLASGATLRPLSLVVIRYLGVGQRSCASRRCVQRCRQDPLQGVARSSVATPVWTLSFSLRLP
jgi:hypothetical protein